FASKQRERFRSAVAGTVNLVLDDGTPYDEYVDDLTAMSRSVAGFVRQAGPRTSLVRLTRLYVSPYRYHHLPPWPEERIASWSGEPDSFWYLTHHWNPASDSALVRARFDRLNAYLERCGTRLFVVNLPEHPIIQRGYEPGYYEAYLKLVRESVPESAFLDLRTTMTAEDFYDAGHLTLPNALRVTTRTIEFMKRQDSGDAAGLLASLESNRP
ncbi:MAG TPA: hypothetical protein VF190_07510, partial [Rhodothermales bacterium]